MANILTPSLTISGNKEVVKERLLPMHGRVVLAEGSEVSPDTIVAESTRPGELHIVRVADSLNLSPAESLGCISVQTGQQVEKGGALAESSSMWGLLNSVVSSPVDGIVEFITPATGHLGIREAPIKVEVASYVHGAITEVHEQRGVSVTSQAIFIQGIFGVGGEKTGNVKLLPVENDQQILENHIPDDCQGLILSGGCSPTIEALQKAERCGAVGLIAGSIDDTVLSQYVGYDIGIAVTGDEDLSMTLIITEGFGTIELNPKIRQLLTYAEGKSASINGATQVRAGAIRPEIIVSHSVLEPMQVSALLAEDPHTQGLEQDSDVRIIRFPFFGRQGQVVNLPDELVQLETGAYARVVQVRLRDTGEEIVVPRANIELVL